MSTENQPEPSNKENIESIEPNLSEILGQKIQDYHKKIGRQFNKLAKDFERKLHEKLEELTTNFGQNVDNLSRENIDRLSNRLETIGNNFSKEIFEVFQTQDKNFKNLTIELNKTVSKSQEQVDGLEKLKNDFDKKLLAIYQNQNQQIEKFTKELTIFQTRSQNFEKSTQDFVLRVQEQVHGLQELNNDFDKRFSKIFRTQDQYLEKLTAKLDNLQKQEELLERFYKESKSNFKELQATYKISKYLTISTLTIVSIFFLSWIFFPNSKTKIETQLQNLNKKMNTTLIAMAKIQDISNKNNNLLTITNYNTKTSERDTKNILTDIEKILKTANHKFKEVRTIPVEVGHGKNHKFEKFLKENNISFNKVKKSLIFKKNIEVKIEFIQENIIKTDYFSHGMYCKFVNDIVQDKKEQNIVPSIDSVPFFEHTGKSLLFGDKWYSNFPNKKMSFVTYSGASQFVKWLTNDSHWATCVYESHKEKITKNISPYFASPSSHFYLQIKIP